MARPMKEGLDYFPLDVDIDSDEKVGYVLARHGFEAFGILIKVLMEIYRQGYCMMWTERQQYLLSRQLNVDSMYAITVVSAYINEGFFSSNLYEKYEILTSHGIQTRYLQAISRRSTVKMAREYLLLDSSEVPKNVKIIDLGVNAHKNPSYCQHNADSNEVIADIMSAKSTQSKVKESIYTTTTTRARENDDDTPSHTQPSSCNEELGKVIEMYAKNVNPSFGPIEAEQLAQLYDEYKSWVVEAIREAVSSTGRPSLRYIEAILKRWKREGFKSSSKGSGANGASRNGSNKRHETDGLRRLKEDMAWADAHAIHPWDVQAKAGGAGSTQS